MCFVALFDPLILNFNQFLDFPSISDAIYVALISPAMGRVRCCHPVHGTLINMYVQL